MGVVGNPILNESDLPFLCIDGRADTLGVEQKCRGESGGLVNKQLYEAYIESEPKRFGFLQRLTNSRVVDRP